MEEQPQNQQVQQTPQEITPPPTLQGQSFKGVPDNQPLTSGFPWLKLVGFVFVLLAAVNLGLFYYLGQTKNRSGLPDEQVGSTDTQGFLLTKPDQTISRDGYSITFLNPRYENLDTQNFFRVDVTLVNQSIKPSIKVIANCDIAENGQIVKEGAGVQIEVGEITEVTPGNSANWTARVTLKNKDQKVSSCIYAPEGVFEPKQTVRVVF